MVRYEEYLKVVMKEFAKNSMIKPEAFPKMELYADQVAGFINKSMSAYEGENDEPFLTKTMINNYVKNNMIPSPDKKKYSRDHVMMLVAILYLKSTFPISDIKTLMKPFVDNYNSTFEEKFDILEMYNSIGSYFQRERFRTATSIQNDINNVKNSIRDHGLEDDDMTEISLLLIDLALKVDTYKYAAEALLQEYYGKLSKHEKKLMKEQMKEQKKEQKKEEKLIRAQSDQ